MAKVAKDDFMTQYLFRSDVLLSAGRVQEGRPFCLIQAELFLPELACDPIKRAEFGGGYADLAFEEFGKMRLAGESGSQSNFNQREIRRRKLAAAKFNPQIPQILAQG